jgi:hypothetical protein
MFLSFVSNSVSNSPACRSILLAVPLRNYRPISSRSTGYFSQHLNIKHRWDGYWVSVDSSTVNVKTILLSDWTWRRVSPTSFTNQNVLYRNKVSKEKASTGYLLRGSWIRIPAVLNGVNDKISEVRKETEVDVVVGFVSYPLCQFRLPQFYFSLASYHLLFFCFNWWLCVVLCSKSFKNPEVWVV